MQRSILFGSDKLTAVSPYSFGTCSQMTLYTSYTLNLLHLGFGFSRLDLSFSCPSLGVQLLHKNKIIQYVGGISEMLLEFRFLAGDIKPVETVSISKLIGLIKEHRLPFLK